MVSKSSRQEAPVTKMGQMDLKKINKKRRSPG
jgi:hypothetical protein